MLRTLGNLARVMETERRGDEAIAMVEESVSRHGPRSRSNGLLGDLLLNARLDARAAEVFDRLLARTPTTPTPGPNGAFSIWRAGRPTMPLPDTSRSS